MQLIKKVTEIIRHNRGRGKNLKKKLMKIVAFSGEQKGIKK